MAKLSRITIGALAVSSRIRLAAATPATAHLWPMHCYWLPLAEESELVIGSATALTRETVSRGESFDLRGGIAAIDPSPQPAPQGEGAVGDENPSV